MNIYVGNYWVPFPRSEYGGMWTVIADTISECVDLLAENSCDPEYDDLIFNAVVEAECITLFGEHRPRVVQTFYT